MHDILDLDRYPLDRPEQTERLYAACRAALLRDGMFNLDGFIRPAAVEAIVAEVASLAADDSYTHQREHNVYFRREVDGLPGDHPALKRFKTINHTVCGDQLRSSLLTRIYFWQPLQAFIGRVIAADALYPMDDEIARINVMEYRPGEALNWHFDRSRYTTTILLRGAQRGGEFQYRTGLRCDDSPNYEGVGRFLSGEDSAVLINPLAAGTLNVFAGKDTLHRVSTVEGGISRLVAVFSYYDRPGVTFSAEERLGFYGRATARED